MDYLAFKSIHIFGVILFIGNIIVTGYWKVMADRTGNKQVIAFAQRLVTLTDWIFTFGGVGLVLVGIYGMSFAAGLDIFGEPWMVWGQSLFITSGVVWVLVLIPVQIKQARLAKKFTETEPIPDKYWRLNRLWIFWGTVATIIPLLNLYFMVFKP